MDSKLLNIAVELQASIIDVLDPASKLTLRITNRHFFSLMKRPTLQDLIAAETTLFAMTRGLFSCMNCLRLRPSAKFADKMRNGKKGRNGLEPHMRFCIECGLRTQRYSPGSRIGVHGEIFIVCQVCRSYVAAWDCEKMKDCSISLLCKGCHGRMGCRKRLVAARSYDTWRQPVRELDDQDLLEGYDSDFWESHDPAD